MYLVETYVFVNDSKQGVWQTITPNYISSAASFAVTQQRH